MLIIGFYAIFRTADYVSVIVSWQWTEPVLLEQITKGTSFDQKPQFTISALPMIHLVYSPLLPPPPQILHKYCFWFLLGRYRNTQEKLEATVMQTFVWYTRCIMGSVKIVNGDRQETLWDNSNKWNCNFKLSVLFVCLDPIRFTAFWTTWVGRHSSVSHRFPFQIKATPSYDQIPNSRE